jgi:hypothetical protein
MPVYRNSKADMYYADGVERNEPCEVRIGEDGSIAVSSQAEDGPQVYEGKEINSGHFTLECARKRGRATLHRVPGENVLEGWWLEGGEEGMFRIELDE